MLQALASLTRRHTLVSFFALAYALCLGAFALYIAYPAIPLTPFRWIGIFSPTISALVVAAVVGGRAEVRRLLSGFGRWRIGWQWYLAVSVMLLGPLALVTVYIALGNPPVGVDTGMTFGSYIGAIAYTLCAGPLAEELGWRGFALPRLQERFNALNASLLLGLLWACWHLPQYPAPNNAMIPFPIFLPICVCLAILFTWFYNNTGGSLVATVLAHFLFNFDGAWLSGYLGLVPPMVLNIAGGISIGIMVVVVIAYAGAKYLSRKPREQLPFHSLGLAA